MTEKKQIVTIMSITLLAFLIGTLFNMNFIATGGKGKDKDEDLWKAIFKLQSEVDSLNVSLVELQSRVETLESLSGFPTPDYDSGWMNISCGEIITLEHGLGSIDVLSYIVGKYDADGTLHHWMYGIGLADTGAVWYGLNSSHITVNRRPNDLSLQARWNQIRVMIWKIPQPPT